MATSASVNAHRGDAHARRGRPSGRRSRLRTPAGATSARAGDARRGDVSAGSGAMSCSTGRGDVRAQRTPVGARSARVGGARRRARGKGACDRTCSGLPLVIVREGPPSGLGQGADGRTRRGRLPGHPDDHARVSKKKLECASAGNFGRLAWSDSVSACGREEGKGLGRVERCDGAGEYLRCERLVCSYFTPRSHLSTLFCCLFRY